MDRGSAEIKAKRVKTLKNDREDARLLRRLMLEHTFLESGCRIQRTGICDNCCGTGIGWCRCAHGS